MGLNFGTMRKFILSVVLMAILPSAFGDLTAETALMAEQIAFRLCDSDGNESLSWKEVQSCTLAFAPMLATRNIDKPSWEHFHAMDVNEDGELTLQEWRDWVHI